LARAVRRGLANMKIQAYLTAAAVNLKRLAAAVAALLLMLLPIHRQSRSCTAAWSDRLLQRPRLYASHLPSGRPCPVSSGAISSVDFGHRELVAFMSEQSVTYIKSSRRGRCRHRYANRPRSSTEFDSIVPVEYRGESQVLRFSCQRRALLTTSIRRQQRAGRQALAWRRFGCGE